MPEPKTPSRAFPWMALAFMTFVLLVLGGVVALSYSPLIDHLFSSVNPDPPPSSPSDRVPTAPGPDNAIKQAPSPPTSQFPGPDNTTTSAPSPSGTGGAP